MRLRLRSVDVTAAVPKVREANNAALGITAENVLSDCREYVPYDSGALQGSGRTRLTDGSAYVEWGGDSDTSRYAREQYYNAHNHATDQNALHAPRACDHWCERARADRGDAWQQMYDKALKERI